MMRMSKKGIVLSVLFEHNGKFDIWVTVIEVVKNWVAMFLLSNKVKAVVINGSIVTLTHPGLVLIHVK